MLFREILIILTFFISMMNWKGVFAAVLITIFSGNTFAAVISEANFDEVVSGSELIFQGRVISKEVRRHPADGRPTTYVTFSIIDILKGSHDGESIELGFEGGTIDGVTLEISDLEIPIIGEHGVYFVEDTQGYLSNPLFGWHQGHYLVEKDIEGKEVMKRMDSPAQVLKQAKTFEPNTFNNNKTGMSLSKFKISVQRENNPN